MEPRKQLKLSNDLPLQQSTLDSFLKPTQKPPSVDKDNPLNSFTTTTALATNKNSSTTTTIASTNGNLVILETQASKKMILEAPDETDKISELNHARKHPSIDKDKQLYSFPFTDKPYWRHQLNNLTKIEAGKVTDFSQLLSIMEDLLRTKCKNPQLKTSFATLKKFFGQITTDQSLFYFKELLPFMARLAMKLEALFPFVVPLLCQRIPSTITLSKQQCACLLANMFFCTLQTQSSKKLPWGIDFSEWLKYSYSKNCNIEKIKCLFLYFEKVYKTLPAHNITFTRSVLNSNVYGCLDYKVWLNSKVPLSKAFYRGKGNIEDCANSCHVDFANKFLGGGVLGDANCQEEILFTIMPECIVGILFSECMQDHEAILITGVERYCKYKGYASSFVCEGAYEDSRGVDQLNRRESMIIAIDAISFKKMHENEQFTLENVARELNKAFVGFSGEEGDQRAIATGRWGCGVFKGDSQLKFVIQWLAASKCKKQMVFYGFEDKRLHQVEEVIRKYEKGYVYDLMMVLDGYIKKNMFKKDVSLFNYMLDGN